MATIEPVTNIYEGTFVSTTSSSFTYYRDRFHTYRHNTPTRKVETKKERIKRIATEKMFASWNMHNKKTEHIIEIIQVCKPRHKFNHLN